MVVDLGTTSLVYKSAIDRRRNEKSMFFYSFGAPDMQLGITTHHNYMAPEVAEERMNGRLTIVARDNEEVLIANFSPNTPAWAIKQKIQPWY